MRLAVVTSHPIQYHSPWFRAMANQPGLDLEVLYCHNATPKEQAAAGFGVEFDWDQPLLDGYSHRFLHNVARSPSVSSFWGMDTPELFDVLPLYDAVLVSGWHYKSAWQAMRACWRERTPVMVRSDSHLHTERSGFKRIAKEIPYRWFISRLDACLPVGQLSKDYFLHYGAPNDRIFLVPHGVDDFFESERGASEEKPALRRAWRLGLNQTVFLFCGKFIEEKRPLDFVQAVARASLNCQGIVGLMVGDGPLRTESQRIAIESNIPIRFAGFLNQSDIAGAYIAADVLVVPSDETWGLVVNEAMSCRRPCLVSDQVGCAPDLIVEGHTGFTFPRGDTGELAVRMVKCAANPQQLVVMGENAQARIAKYSISVAVEGVIQALNRVVKCQ